MPCWLMLLGTTAILSALALGVLAALRPAPMTASLLAVLLLSVAVRSARRLRLARATLADTASSHARGGAHVIAALPTASSHARGGAHVIAALPTASSHARGGAHVIAALPTAVAVSIVSRPVGLAALGAVAAWGLTQLRPRDVQMPGGAVMASIAIAAGLVWSRQDNPGTTAYYVLVFAMLAVFFGATNRATALVATIDGVGLYLAANVFAYYALGVRSPSSGTRNASLGAANGGIDERVFFPLSYSLNAVPAIAASYAVATVAFLVFVPSLRRWFRVAGFGAASLILLLTNARGALALTVVITVIVLCYPSRLRVWGTTIAVLASALPLLYPLLQPAVAPSLNAAGRVSAVFEARIGEADNASLNGRDVIWRESLSAFANAGHARQLMGHGPAGHVSSGASLRYEGIFRAYQGDRAAISPHSSSLQQLLDAGVVGTAALLVALLLALSRGAAQARGGSPIHAASTGGLIVLLATGATETLVAPAGLSPAFVIALSLVLGLGTTRRRLLPQQARHDRPFVDGGRARFRSKRPYNDEIPAVRKSFGVVEPVAAKRM